MTYLAVLCLGIAFQSLFFFLGLLTARVCGGRVDLPPAKGLAWKLPTATLPLVLGASLGVSAWYVGLAATFVLLMQWFKLGLTAILATGAVWYLLQFGMLHLIRA